ncbi:hypothetical protein HKCCE2091_17660 [Rhodobacterales bacterium HKCCE2091]|nr:hypothetical protein [Rhodobacterales bacterium HKCCE2091]
MQGLLPTLIGNVIGGVVGQAIYAALILLALRWVFKLRAPYGPLFVTYLIVFLVLFVVSFALGYALGAAGAVEVLGVLMAIISIAAFVGQAWLVSKRVTDAEGVPLPFGKVLLSQIIILVIFIVIGVIVVALAGGF